MLYANLRDKLRAAPTQPHLPQPRPSGPPSKPSQGRNQPNGHGRPIPSRSRSTERSRGPSSSPSPQQLPRACGPANEASGHLDRPHPARERCRRRQARTTFIAAGRTTRRANDLSTRHDGTPRSWPSPRSTKHRRARCSDQPRRHRPTPQDHPLPRTSNPVRAGRGPVAHQIRHLEFCSCSDRLTYATGEGTTVWAMRTRCGIECALIIPMIIQTILLYPFRAVWTDAAPNVSR
jgi:hypothetical protein